MATGLQSQELVPENLRKLLAAAVSSIQWSYAIFWSTSSAQPGVLEWGEGYYNGDIKTRKTMQAVELNDDLIGLQRSEQLRELYESLLAGESNPQSRRHSAALLPEDLTNSEWYYLVCMSFDFNIGQGLPGRALMNGQPIWLCHAQSADSKIFSRSLLAKSASIQTVVCFPFFGGVVELGVTKLVSEDLGLVHHIRTCLSDMPHNFFNMETVVTPVIMEEVESQTKSSDEVRQVEAVGDELKMEESIHGEVLQAGSCFHLMEDDLSNCIYSSMTSSDCMSQTFFHPNNIISTSPKAENTDGTRDNTNNAKFEYLELQQGDEDMHYQNVLSSLFKTSHTLMLRPSIQDRYKESSFVCWRKLGTQAIRQPQDQIIPQRMLKKILLQVPRLHNDISLSKTGELGGERLDVIFRPEADETHVNHVKERFSSLESLIPLTSKADEVSILDDTIVYLKELERRVEELESCQDVSEHAKRKPDQDMVERTSDYYHQHNSKAGGSKRKASDLDEGMQETSHVSFTDASCENISITMIDKDILIEIKCPWRHYLLLEIIDMLSNLHLDSYSVQSSNIDGILFLTMKSKLRGLIGISAGMIRQALQRVLQKCGIP